MIALIRIACGVLLASVTVSLTFAAIYTIRAAWREAMNGDTFSRIWLGVMIPICLFAIPFLCVCVYMVAYGAPA